MNYNYYRTFIRVSADCPVKRSVIPVLKGERPSIAVLEYGLLSSAPYAYTQEELLFLVHVRREGISRSVLESNHEALWTDYFSRSRACLRASPLSKRYGWGFHFDDDGKVALVPVESEEYQRLESDGSLTQIPAMRNRRA